MAGLRQDGGTTWAIARGPASGRRAQERLQAALLAGPLLECGSGVFWKRLRPVQPPAVPAHLHCPLATIAPCSFFLLSGPASLLTEQILICTWELASLGVPPEAPNMLEL